MKKVACLLLFPLAALCGQPGMTGNARIDLLSAGLSDSLQQLGTVIVRRTLEPSNEKSPLLGSAISLLVPGAGEYYSDRYVKTAVFLAAEAVTLTLAIVYNNKGNTQTTSFQNYANQHWSAVDYATWINQNGAAYDAPGAAAPNLYINPNTSLPPWQRVDFGQINAWESEAHTIGFSHELPTYNTQQYYELIGKYSEFKYGWDTYVGKDGTRYGDDGYDVTYIPQQMKNYADNRGKANDYYYTAGLATALVVVNHVLSALDAAWSTSNYNKELTSEVGMKVENAGGGTVALATQLTIKVQL